MDINAPEYAPILELMDTIRELMTPEEPNRRRIGFESPADAGGKTLKARALQLRKKQVS